ncbi:MAG TPA: hypothetical protein VK670_12990 [Silvibacterium sp.]|nr:hypothetical protein [Silvibacterium sp.]
MKATARKTDQRSVTVDAERLLHAGKDYDTVLAFLRDRGFGKLDSIKFLCDAGKLPLIKAKELVHDSVVWSDAFARDERLHESLMRSLAEIRIET